MGGSRHGSTLIEIEGITGNSYLVKRVVYGWVQ